MKKLITTVVFAVFMSVSNMVSADITGTAVWSTTGIFNGDEPMYGVVLDYRIQPNATTIPVHGFLVFSNKLFPCDGSLVDEGGFYYVRLNSGPGSLDMYLDYSLNGDIIIFNYAGKVGSIGKLYFK